MRKPGIALSGLGAVLLITWLLSFTLGRYPIAPGEVLGMVLSRIFPIEPYWTTRIETVFFNVRLPRILLACLVGGSLAAAGTAYQCIFQNPMASPDVLGASSGAAFGAGLAILLGWSRRYVTASAFICGIIAVALVMAVGARARGNRVAGLVLSGIMIGSLFSAGISYIKLVADPADQLPAITYWLMGSLAGTQLTDVLTALVPMALGLTALLLLRWRLNLLALGDDEARALGINAALNRTVIVGAATLLTAASVAVSGTIGWVGLVAPHFARKLVGNDNRYALPASMLLGALFLLLADDAARTLWSSEIPIGILTAFVGAPFFIYLLLGREVSE